MLALTVFTNCETARQLIDPQERALAKVIRQEQKLRDETPGVIATRRIPHIQGKVGFYDWDTTARYRDGAVVTPDGNIIDFAVDVQRSPGVHERVMAAHRSRRDVVMHFDLATGEVSSVRFL